MSWRVALTLPERSRYNWHQGVPGLLHLGSATGYDSDAS